MIINLPPYHDNPDPNWAGLTLREIEMRRVMVQARMEIEKYKMANMADVFKNNHPVLSGSNFFGRIMRAFSFAEYAFLAVKLFKMVRPLFSKK